MQTHWMVSPTTTAFSSASQLVGVQTVPPSIGSSPSEHSVQEYVLRTASTDMIEDELHGNVQVVLPSELMRGAVSSGHLV